MRVICQGNARKFGLRVVGKRNALWLTLNRRTCVRQSGTTPSFGAGIRSNTHTCPNYRLPPLAGFHDDELCKRNCVRVEPHELKRVCKLAQRAQREATGYFCGYTCKRQPVGRFELREILKLMNFVEAGLVGRKAGAQMNRARSKMVSDLHHRSMIRVAPEEFNLAANHHPHDVGNAEFIRTYMNVDFHGGKLSQRLEAEKNVVCRTRRYILPTLPGATDKKEIHVKLFDDFYGYRGKDPRVYYLSPWEFIM